MRLASVRLLAFLMILVLLGLAGACPIRAADRKLPVYNGKSLKEWLGAWDRELPPEQAAERAKMREDIRKVILMWKDKLKDSDEHERHLAAGALGYAGPDAAPAVPNLIDALKDSSAGVRAAAASALSQVGRPARAAIGPLIELLRDKDTDVRHQAARALGLLGRDARRAVPALIRTLGDPKPKVRCNAAFALAGIDEPKDSVPALIERLADKDPSVRFCVALSLGCFGPQAKAAIGPLIEQLRKDPTMREVVITSLPPIGPAAVPAVIELLKDRDARVREAATTILILLGPEAKGAVAPLARSLKDPDEQVQRGACSALAQIGEPAVGPLVAALRDEDEKIRHLVCDALVFIGKPAVNAVANVLRGPDEQARKPASEVLMRIGLPAVPSVIAALEDKDPLVRKEAVSILYLLKQLDKGLVKSLAGAVNDPDERVRREAIGSLGWTGKPALPYLIEALKSNKVDVRSAAAATLGSLAEAKDVTDQDRKEVLARLVPLLGDQEEVQTSVVRAMAAFGKMAMPALITALKSKEAAVRLGAIRTLIEGGMNARPAIPALLALYDDPDQDVRTHAEMAILYHTGTPAMSLAVAGAPRQPVYAGKRLSEWLTGLESEYKWKSDAAQAALRREGKKLVPLLRADLKSRDRLVRIGVARVLGALGPDAEPAMPELLAALQTPSDRLAEEAAGALYASSARAAVGPLLELLGDKDSNTRRHAAFALGILPKSARRTAPAILRALNDPQPGVRAVAVQALVWITDAKTSVPALIERLGDMDSRVRQAAASALRSLGRKAAPAQGRLIDLLRSDPRARPIAMEALERIGPQAVHSLLDLLDDKDPGVRSSAAEILGKLGPRATEAGAPLIRALQDPGEKVQWAARRALAQIGPPAIPALVAALSERDEITANGAGWALTEIGKPAIKPVAEVFRGPNKKAREQAATVLVGIGEPAVPTLLAALEDKNAGVRAEAASALWKMSSRPKGVLKPLANALNDPDEKVRQKACSALEQFGKPAVPFLTSALKNKRADVRSQVAEALGFIGTEGTDQEKMEIAALLVALLDDQEDFQITWAIQGLGKSAVPSLISALKSKKAKVRSAAAGVLGNIVSQRTDQEKQEIAARLIPLLADDEQVRTAATEALKSLGKPAVPALVIALKHKETAIRLGAVKALGALGADAVSAIAALQVVCEEDPDFKVRWQAGVTLRLLHFD